MKKSKSDLLKLLSEIDSGASNLIDESKEITRTATTVKDLVGLSISEINSSPLGDDPDLFYADFYALKNDLDGLSSKHSALASLASGITFGTASTMTTISGSSLHNYRTTPSYTNFYNKFDEVIDRGSIKDQIIDSMKKLELDKTKDGKEAMKSLQSAWEVHLVRTGDSTSSLIPMREAIAKTLRAINAKTAQSKIKKWISDVLNKVKFGHVTQKELDDLQQEHDTLRDELSGSKNIDYPREKEKQLLREATLHLQKILSAVDKGKFTR